MHGERDAGPKGGSERMNAKIPHGTCSSARSMREAILAARAARSPRKTSPYIGVGLHVARGKFCAFVRFKGKRIYLGLWREERDAAVARDRASLFFRLHERLNLAKISTALGPASPQALRRLARRGDGTRTRVRHRITPAEAEPTRSDVHGQPRSHRNPINHGPSSASCLPVTKTLGIPRASDPPRRGPALAPGAPP